MNGNVDFEDYEYAAKAGDYNVDTIDEYEQTRVAIDFFMFPEYHGGSYSNDIALLGEIVSYIFCCKYISNYTVLPRL